jgi:hypothetical protein
MKDDAALLIEVITDLQVEIKAIHDCLIDVETESLHLEAKREDARRERATIREDVVKRLAELRALVPNAP